MSARSFEPERPFLQVRGQGRVICCVAMLVLPSRKGHKPRGHQGNQSRPRWRIGDCLNLFRLHPDLLLQFTGSVIDDNVKTMYLQCAASPWFGFKRSPPTNAGSHRTISGYVPCAEARRDQNSRTHMESRFRKHSSQSRPYPTRNPSSIRNPQ